MATDNLPQNPSEKQYILITCDMCGGSGELACRFCDDGWVTNSWGDYDRCPYCDGDGERECKNCKGTGQLEEPVGAGGGGTGPISDEALLVLHDIAEGESTGDPDEYREWDSMVSQEQRIIQAELEPHYVTFITIPVNDGKRAMSFWIVTPAGLDLLRAPRGTTTLDRLQERERKIVEELRIASDQYSAFTFDEIHALIDILDRIAPAPAQPSAPAVTVTNTLTPAHYELLDTLLACDIDIDKQAPENVALLRTLESQRLVFRYTEDGYGKPCNAYAISSNGLITIRQYQRNERADAAQPEAARAGAKPAAVKLSKRQIEFLSLAVRNGGEVHHRNAMYIASGRGNAAVMKGLVSLGLMEDVWRGWRITDKGRDALEAVSR